MRANASCCPGRRASASPRCCAACTATTVPDRGHIMIRHRGEMVDLATADPRTILAVRHETLGYVSQFLRVVPRVPALDIVAEVLIERGSTQRRGAAHRDRSPAAAEHPAPAARLAAGDLLRRRAAAREPGARLHRQPSRAAAGRADRVARCREPRGRRRDDQRGEGARHRHHRDLPRHGCARSPLPTACSH